jgi:hypothetical protein
MRLLVAYRSIALVLVLVFATLPQLSAQQQSKPPSGSSADDLISESNEKLFLSHLLQDQRSLWTSPLRVKPKDAAWLVPMAGITTGLIMTDESSAHEMSRGNVSRAATFSDAALAAYGGGVVGLYLLGRAHGSPQAQETGLLAAEAGINSLAIGEALKYAFQRERPSQNDGKGHFFRSGGTSFYSGHATIAWSFASVIAHEYPGWLSKTLAYGAATTVSLSRVKAEKHFPADVFVGALSGYLIGGQIYNGRHDPNIDREFGTFANDHAEWNSRNAGTTYVPLDSWVYPAIERLIAAGLVRNQFLGLRPWTRTAIADMLAEADYRVPTEQKLAPEMRALLNALRSEFADETKLGSQFDNQAIRLESLYTRSMVISGPPLNDSYHFGQTMINDFGRPYQRGFNQIVGFTARAEQGRFAYYVRGEYQHAPSAPAYPLSVRQVIADADRNPLQPATAFSETNDFRLVDAYASMTVAGHVVSVGKQSLWWGPNSGDAMIMSNNAEPFYSLRINRAVPLKLPWILKYLGPVRYDGFFGRLEGHQFPPRPFMHGEKFSFKPTENLEFGFSRTAVFAGEGVTPLTFGNFWESFSSTTSSTNPGFDLRRSAGARHGAFDFSYRIPGLRNWLTLYSDSLVHDDVSPIDAPRSAAINPGIYVSHFPSVSKLDLRVEAVNTDPPITRGQGGTFIYYEGIYRDVYTNKKDLMGSWIGREGKGVQAWSTYWFSPVTSIQLGYRNAKVAKDFIPGGETSNSYSLRAQLRITSDLELTGWLQCERWKAPVLAPGLQSNVTTAIQLRFWPSQIGLSKR